MSYAKHTVQIGAQVEPRTAAMLRALATKLHISEAEAIRMSLGGSSVSALCAEANVTEAEIMAAGATIKERRRGSLATASA